MFFSVLSLVGSSPEFIEQEFPGRAHVKEPWSRSFHGGVKALLTACLDVSTRNVLGYMKWEIPEIVRFNFLL